MESQIESDGQLNGNGVEIGIQGAKFKLLYCVLAPIALMFYSLFSN